MRRENYEQFIVISETNAAAFQEKVNETIRAHAKEQPKVKIEMQGGFQACISYTNEVLIPENIVDEYELNGVVYLCQDCPLFSLPNDKRVKRFRCVQDNRLCRADSTACAWLYEQMEKGGRK